MKYLIVGLGNPGHDYENTRHNVGFKVLDYMCEEKEGVFKLDSQGHVATIKHKGRQLLLLKPTTFMNLSGKAVNYWLTKEKIPRENLLVIVDDLALPFGKQRLRAKGDPGGHNGLKHIDQILGNNQYARLRVGIGNEFQPGRQVDHVLGQWSSEEVKLLPDVQKYAADTAYAFCTIGIQMTMNQFNKK